MLYGACTGAAWPGRHRGMNIHFFTNQTLISRRNKAATASKAFMLTTQMPAIRSSRRQSGVTG
jgi:hypothetical protein